jgi:hypothetical protein
MEAQSKCIKIKEKYGKHFVKNEGSLNPVNATVSRVSKL